MRLPVYLQVALALSISALTTQQDRAGHPLGEAPGPAFMEEGTDVRVCRQTSPDDPADLETDTVLISVQDSVETLMASVPAEDSTAFLAALRYSFGEVTFEPHRDYITVWDAEAMEWVLACIDRNTYTVRGSSQSNPVEVVVIVSLEL